MFDFHLHMARFSAPKALAKGLLSAGVGFNTIACEPWEWERTLDQTYGEGAHFAFGVHPMIAARTTDTDLKRLEEILLLCPEYHVGECGLDKRFEGYEEGGIQEQILTRQVQMAVNLHRPLQVHCVGDYSRILKIIAANEGGATIQGTQPDKDDAKIPQVVLHRFGGDISVVRTALKQLGTRAIFSIHADTFRKKSAAAALREIPPAQIRFETDADETFAEKFGENPEAIIQQLQDVEEKFTALLAKE